MRHKTGKRNALTVLGKLSIKIERANHWFRAWLKQQQQQREP